MFDALARRGELQQAEQAGRPLIATTEIVIGQARQDFYDREVALAHSQDMDLLKGLLELDEAIDVPGLVNECNTVVADVTEYRNWQVAAEAVSWIPEAHAAVVDGGIKDGVRAVRAWRLHWKSQKELRQLAPSESLIALYQRQENGALLPPRAAVVPFRKDDQDSRQRSHHPETARDITDAIRQDSFKLHEYHDLRRIIDGKSYEDYTREEMFDFLARYWGLKNIVDLDCTKSSRIMPVYHHQYDIEMFHRQDEARYGVTNFRKPYKDAAAALTDPATIQHDANTSVAGRLGVSAEAGMPYQSFMDLDTVNRHFTPATEITVYAGSEHAKTMRAGWLGRTLGHLPKVEAEDNQGIVDAYSWASPDMAYDLRSDVMQRLDAIYQREAVSRQHRLAS